MSEVSALRLPLPEESDPNRFTWGPFPEVSALYFALFLIGVYLKFLVWNIPYLTNCGYRANTLSK